MVVIGFLMLTLGIITGSVWAHSAWGTYWSWDPKETWSLITWLVYASVIHSRMVRKWKGKKIAILCIIGFACVLFTYFGVNYYLSGLHSYASGDPMPIPPSIYYVVIALTIISLLAYWRHQVYLKNKVVEG